MNKRCYLSETVSQLSAFGHRTFFSLIFLAQRTNSFFAVKKTLHETPNGLTQNNQSWRHNFLHPQSKKSPDPLFQVHKHIQISPDDSINKEKYLLEEDDKELFPEFSSKFDRNSRLLFRIKEAMSLFI